MMLPKIFLTIVNLTLYLNLEVVEHVDDLNLYLQSCSKLLKKNGIMFTATINRNLTSYLKAIVGAEYILKMASYWNS